MKTHFSFEGGNNPVLKIVPQPSEQISELRYLVRNLHIENTALTFAREYRKFEHGEPSMFDNLSQEQIERIAMAADRLSNLWKDSQTNSNEPEINIIKLLETLFSTIIDNLIYQ